MPDLLTQFTPGTGTGVGIGDYASSIYAGGAQAVAAIPALQRWASEGEEDPANQAANAAAKYLQFRLGRTADDAVKGMSYDAQRALNSTIASSDFWSQPFSASFLKLANSSPSVAAGIVGAALSGGSAIPALVSAGIVSGGLSAGETVDTIQREVDKTDDNSLQQNSTYYAGLRASGMSEQQARSKLSNKMIGHTPLLLFAAGVATGALGPAGQVTRALNIGGSRALLHGAERGIVGGVLKETAEGFGTETVQSGLESGVTQQARVEAGFQPAVDVGQVAAEALTGGLAGALAGGPTGVVGGHPRATQPGKANPAIASTTPALPVNPVAPPSTLSAGSVTPPTGSTARVKPTNQKKTTTTPASGQPTTAQVVNAITAGQQPSVTATAVPGVPAPLAGAAVATPATPSTAAPAPVAAPPLPNIRMAGGELAQGVNAGRALSDSLGLTAEIDKLAFEGNTVAQTVKVLGNRITHKQPTLFVRQVKSSLGIPSLREPDKYNAWKAAAAQRYGTQPSSTPTSGPPSVKRGGSLGVTPKIAPADTTTAGTRPAGTQQARKPAADLTQPTVTTTPTVKSPSPEQAAALATKRAEQAPAPAPPTGAQATTPAPAPAGPLAGAGRPRTPSQVQQATGAPLATATRIAQGEGWTQTPAAQPAPEATPLVPGATEPLTTVAPAPATPVGAQPRPRAPVRLTAALGTKPAPTTTGRAPVEAVTPQAVAQVAPVMLNQGKPGLRPVRQRTVTAELTPKARQAVEVQKARLAPGKLVAGRVEEPLAAPVARPTTAAAPETGPTVLPDIGGEFVEPMQERRDVETAGRKALLAADRKREQQAGKSHKGKDEQAAAEANANTAARIHTENMPDEYIQADTPEARAEVRTRVDNILTEAEQAGVKIPTTVNDKTPGPLAWLREVADLKETLDKQTREAPEAREHIDEFLSREFSTKDGDFSVLKSARKAGGEEKSRVYQGDVEQVAAVPSLGTGEAATKVSKLALGTLRGIGEGGEPASKVRKVELTPELKAKYEALAGKVAAKPAVTERLAAAEEHAPLAKAPAAEPAAKGKAKAEEVKAKAKPTPEAKGKAQVQKVRAEKQAAAKAKLQEEVDKVERDRTEREDAAKNYQQGHVSLDGNRVTIQVPKGDTLAETQPDGRRTVVTVKHHVGILNGTEGADGKPITAVLGPKATPGNPDLHDAQVFVVDEKDPVTDAHVRSKVMLGFDDAKKALDAWLGTTHDGNEKRFGDITNMSADQFKAWRKSKEATAPAGVGTESIGVETEPGSRDVLVELGRLARTDPVAFFARMRVEPKSFGTIRKQLFDRPNPVLEKLLERLGKYIDDVPVFSVNDTTFVAVKRGGRRIAAYYDPDNHIIVVNEYEMAQAKQSFGGLDSRARFMAHEGVHAAFLQALTARPELRAAIDQIALELREQLITLGEPFTQYAYLNADEFLAEALSNASMQDWLANTKASHSLKRTIADRRLSLQGRNIRSLWDALRDVVAKTLGLTTNAEHTLLDAIMQVSSELEYHLYTGAKPSAMATDEIAARTQAILSQGAPWRREASGTRFAKYPRWRFEQPGLSLEDVPFSPFKRKPRMEQLPAPRLVNLKGLDMLAQQSKDYGSDFSKPTREVADRTEMIRVDGEKNMQKFFYPSLRDAEILEKKYGAQVWNDYNNYVHDETTAKIWGDRPLTAHTHLGKDTLAGAWPKGQHADLAQRFHDIFDSRPDLLAHRNKSEQVFRDTENAMALGRMRNILDVADVQHPDLDKLARDMFDLTATADDEDIGPTAHDYYRNMVGLDLFDALMKSKLVAKIQGPYHPKMRRGQFAVRGQAPVAPPTGAGVVKLDDGVWEFKGDPATGGAKGARRRAIAYAQSAALKGLPSGVRSVWVDSQNPDPKSNRFFLDAATGKEVKVTPQDIDAEQRFHVTTQLQHLDFKETPREAQEAAQELIDQGYTDVTAAPRRFEPGNVQDDMIRDSVRTQTLTRAMEKRAGFQNLPPVSKNEIIQMLNEAQINFLGSTSIQNRRLPRRNVLGASKNSSANMLEYGESTSAYLARLEHAPARNKALIKMRAAADDRQTDYGKQAAMGRGTIANAVEKHLQHVAVHEPRGGAHDYIQRAVAMASLARLASPAHSMIQLLQNIMVGYPVLASKVGPGRALSLLWKGYRSVGTMHSLKAGAKETLAYAREPGKLPVSFFGDMMNSRNFTTDQKWMLNYLEERGSLGLDVGMETSRLISATSGVWGKVDLALGYLADMARAMPRAMENLNRTTLALATFDAEMARNGGNREAATVMAQETVNRSHGLYSYTDAPKVFNHPLGKLTLQFKRYGHMMYNLLGRYYGMAINDLNPGDRAEAIKALTMLAATHLVFAGALGLPGIEALKWLVVGANVILGTGVKWEDVEATARGWAAGALGPAMGEALTRGIPRVMGVDLSSRVGGGDWATWGEPASGAPDDIFAWLGETFAGAAVGTGVDTARGLTKMFHGHVVEGIELVAPIKILKDAIKDYRISTEGKLTPSGMQSLEAYNPVESAIQALGFTPGRAAETGEARQSLKRATAKITARRTDFERRWAAATPAERLTLWGEVEQYNRSADPEDRITRAQLESYKKRTITQEQKHGFIVNKRTLGPMQQMEGTYNLQ